MRKISNYSLGDDEIKFLSNKKGFSKAKETENKLYELKKKAKNKIKLILKQELSKQKKAQDINKKLVEGLKDY